MPTLPALSQLGVSPHQPEYLQKKIVLSNQVAMATFGIALLYSLFSYYCFPPLVWLPASALLITLATLLVNQQGLHLLSRVIIALLPVLLAGAYHAYLCRAGAVPLPGIYLTQLAFALTPFVVFDLREKAYLTLTAGISLLTIASFPWSNTWLEMPLNDALLREGPLAQASVVVGVGMAFAYLLVLVRLNQQAQAQSQQLLLEMAERNGQLGQSQQQLQASLAQLEQAQAAEKQRNWASAGLADFAHLLGSSSQAPPLFDRVIAQVVKYLEANQGGLYLRQGEGKEAYLQLTACYAYGRKKYGQKRLEPGEGLLGQAYLEKEYIYMTDVPADYVTITSGLGEATPRAILLMPLLNGEQVEGVLELACFRPFEAYQIAFLEKLAGSLAAYIATSRVNQRTEKLLRESQQLTEALQAQEEELRQNMEELEATQEEMRRKEQGYLARIAQLERQTKA